MSWEKSRVEADVPILDGQELEDFSFVWRCIILSDVANQLIKAINRGDLLCTSN